MPIVFPTSSSRDWHDITICDGTMEHYSNVLFNFECRRYCFLCKSVLVVPEKVIGSIGPIPHGRPHETDSTTDRQNSERQTILPACRHSTRTDDHRSESCEESQQNLDTSRGTPLDLFKSRFCPLHVTNLSDGMVWTELAINDNFF
jgi:hypothetical protein